MEDFNRFAIRTIHDPVPPATADGGGEAPAEPREIDRISISAAGRITLRGSVEIVPPERPDPVRGALTRTAETAAAHCDADEASRKGSAPAALQPMDTEFGVSSLIVANVCATRPRGVRFTPPLPLPEEARPWRIYHTDAPKDERPGHRLRVELPDLGRQTNPNATRLAIGHSIPGPCPTETDEATGSVGVAEDTAPAGEETAAEEECCGDSNPPSIDPGECCFEECLAIDADCRLHVPGCLVVQGRVIQTPIEPDPNDPRFVAAQMVAVVQALFDALLLTVAPMSPP
jgi:hypothetical protein